MTYTSYTARIRAITLVLSTHLNLIDSFIDPGHGVNDVLRHTRRQNDVSTCYYNAVQKRRFKYYFRKNAFRLYTVGRSVAKPPVRPIVGKGSKIRTCVFMRINYYYYYKLITSPLITGIKVSGSKTSFTIFSPHSWPACVFTNHNRRAPLPTTESRTPVPENQQRLVFSDRRRRRSVGRSVGETIIMLLSARCGGCLSIGLVRIINQIGGEWRRKKRLVGS